MRPTHSQSFDRHLDRALRRLPGDKEAGLTLYRLDPGAGRADYRHTAGRPENTCSQIPVTPSGLFLYVGNGGHNSIAGFAADPATGRLTATGHAPTKAVPSAFGLDPKGRFLLAAGAASDHLAAYHIDGEGGARTPLAAYAVGRRPAARLG